MHLYVLLATALAVALPAACLLAALLAGLLYLLILIFVTTTLFVRTGVAEAFKVSLLCQGRLKLFVSLMLVRACHVVGVQLLPAILYLLLAFIAIVAARIQSISVQDKALVAFKGV
jgi:hypothetical protein